MKTVLENKTCELIYSDAVEAMDSMKAESVDVIFADPPYNLSNNGVTCQSGRMVSVNKATWDQSGGVEKDFEFHLAWLEACRRLLKPNGSIWVSGTYHSIYQCAFGMQLQGWHLLNDIAWFKPNASPNLSCRMFTASHETLLWARKSKEAKHYFDYESMKQNDWGNDMIKKEGKQMRSVWSIPSPSKAEKKFGKHPTQKPEALLDRVILSSCKKNGVVLDPFCGSGTTGVSALYYGCRFIGIDNKKSYLNIAKKRISEMTSK